MCIPSAFLLSYSSRDYSTLMTPKRPNINKQTLRAVLPLAGLGIVAAALSGCGGATSGGAVSLATPNSGPVIYGINALAQSSGAVTTGETSGLAAISTSSGAASTTFIGALTGAIAYNTVAGAGPLPAYVAAFPNSGGATAGVPLGFAPNGTYFNSSAPVAAVATDTADNLVFGIYVSQGAKGGSLVDINTSSPVLTSPESPTFSLPLVFDPNFGSGALAQTQYKTAAFTLPNFMKTTGLHDLRASIADTAGQSSTTDFAVATVAPTAVAFFLQSFDTGTVDKTNTEVFNAIAPGDTVTVDGGAGIGVYPAKFAPTVADAQGTVVLFTAPGTHTIVETSTTGKVVNTSTFTVAATTAGATFFAVPAPGVTASARPLSAHRVVKPATRS